MSVADKVTSAALKLAIKAKFAAPGFQTFFEVSNDTGARTRTFADAVSVGIWPSSGHVIHGFEIKISRGDWLREVANPGKSQPIFKHCDRWWLVCPAGLVDPSELPKTWGMLTFSKRGDLVEGEAVAGALRTAVKAPALSPEPLTAGFMAALVRRAGEQDESLIAAAVAKAETAMRARRDEEVKRRVERALSDHRNSAEGDRKLGSKIAAAFGEEKAFRWFDDEAFIAAVRFVMASGVHGAYDGLSSMAKQLRQQAERIDRALDPAVGTDAGGSPS